VSKAELLANHNVSEDAGHWKAEIMQLQAREDEGAVHTMQDQSNQNCIFYFFGANCAMPLFSLEVLPWPVMLAATYISPNRYRPQIQML
jgi:hypothetical protein